MEKGIHDAAAPLPAILFCGSRCERPGVHDESGLDQVADEARRVGEGIVLVDVAAPGSGVHAHAKRVDGEVPAVTRYVVIVERVLMKGRLELGEVHGQQASRDTTSRRWTVIGSLARHDALIAAVRTFGQPDQSRWINAWTLVAKVETLAARK